MVIKQKKEAFKLPFLSGYQDSNLGPPAPKAGALTGLCYTPKCSSFRFCECKGNAFSANTQYMTKELRKFCTSILNIQNIQFDIALFVDGYC